MISPWFPWLALAACVTSQPLLLTSSTQDAQHVILQHGLNIPRAMLDCQGVGGVIVDVLLADIRSMEQQFIDTVRVATETGQHQRGALVLILSVQDTASSDEQGHQFVTSTAGRQVQSCL